jgi:cytochrome d ubiquinol oxidase subunit I
MAQFKAQEDGYGLLAALRAGQRVEASPADIESGGWRAPGVAVFWSFRIMVGLGLLMLAYLFSRLSTPCSIRSNRNTPFFGWPMVDTSAFIACEMGWLVAEIGRQPWSLYSPANLDGGVHPWRCVPGVFP